MRRLILALALLASAPQAAAQTGDAPNDLPAGVAEDQITVTSDYRGSYITVS